MQEQVGCVVGSKGGGERPCEIVVLLICLFVVGVIVLAAHWPSLSARALSLDDDQYLTRNRLVLNPSWASAKRFFTEVFEPSTVRGYYQPLAMLSLMLDVAIGGRVNNLTPFHLTSLSLHVANTLLLIVLLYLLFGKSIPAAMAGLLYGVHPTTVESVVWIAERKTLLAAFFGLWCLIFYVCFVRRKKWWYAAICQLMYVLSLLSKPAVIGMPVLLLLLDFWPFNRLGKKTVLEKLPMFLIAAVSAVITIISQGKTATAIPPGKFGLVHILFIFCHNIIFYLYKLFWPVNLSWYYPFPKPFDLSQPMVFFGVVGTAVLVVVLLISLRWTSSLLVGWFFFFVAIFPTLGLISFHPVIAANRHTYFPMVGFLLPVGLLFSRLWDGRKAKIILAVIVAILTASQSLLTRGYLVCWQTTEQVYKNMLEFAPADAVLHNNLANTLADSGRADEAIEHFNRSLLLEPDSAVTHNNLGSLLDELGRTDEAIEHYRKALDLKPSLPEAHYNLATLLAAQGKTDEAIAEFRQALRFKPDYMEALGHLGFALAEKGNFNEAIVYYKKALELAPGHVLTHGRLGLALAAVGRIDEAIEECRFVLQKRPNDAEMHFNVGVLLEMQGKIDEAIRAYRQALQINPDYTEALQHLETALNKQKSR
ncbi:MAG: tetratricopeptide repeat protein [Planctomycetota bacterium]|nr:MAG: tetratricopeptide repeat protein [Planctomycetota bacterium]